jgi:hypothetical protein
MAVTQSHYRFYADGTESGATALAAEDANPSAGVGQTLELDATFHLRFCLQCDGTSQSNVDAEYQYRKNGGTWTNLTTTTNDVRVTPSANLTNAANTTQRLSGTGTFESSSQGVTEDGIAGGSSCDIVANGNAEFLCPLQLRSADLVDGDVIEFRLTRDGGTLINTYAVTPTLTIEIPDTTDPVLTNATVGSVGTTTGTPAVTTDEGDGTIYFVIVANGDSPSVAQIKAGQNSSGGAAIKSGNQAVSAAGVQTFSQQTGLTSNTPYDCWFVHTDSDSNDSTAVKADFSTRPVFDDIRQAILDGIDSAQSEAHGWDVERTNIPVTAVVRTSDTIVTITLPALSAYSITADETLTVTVPAAALAGGSAIVATPTIAVAEGAGATPIEGTLSGTLDAATGSGAATVAVQGTTGATLGAAAAAAAGGVGLSGSTAATLDAATAATAAAVEVTGSAAMTLAAVASFSSATIDLAATLTGALDDSTLAATGTLDSPPIEGTLDVTLEALTRTAAGTVAIDAEASSSLDTLTGAVTAGVAIAAVASPTLETLTVGTTSTVDVSGTVGSTLAAATTSTSGAVSVTAQVGVTLGAIALEGQGAVGDPPITGTLADALAELAGAAAGSVAIAGEVDVTLEGARYPTNPHKVTGRVTVTGSAVASLEALTSASLAAVEITATAGPVLVTVGLAAAAAATVTAVASPEFATLSVSAEGRVTDAPVPLSILQLVAQTHGAVAIAASRTPALDIAVTATTPVIAF